MKTMEKLSCHELPIPGRCAVMKRLDIHAIAAELNSRARQHPIGDLQRIRTEMKGFSRRPGTDIFSPLTTFGDRFGAFHHGGARELQFNIWNEDGWLRHGLAFCLQRTQTLQDPVGTLGPKILRFNKFLDRYAKAYADLRMWHWTKEGQYKKYPPRPIPQKLVREAGFIFLGNRQRLDRLDYEAILKNFDRLLPLYTFVEDDLKSEAVPISSDGKLVFPSGYSRKKSSTVATLVAEQHYVILRQNDLQEAFCRKLAKEYGPSAVADEWRCAPGVRVDVAVRRPSGFWLYEIKVADSARACIRLALGQLLEYAFWPGSLDGILRLVVVGEHELNKAGETYLNILRKRFSLPIEYERFTLGG